MWNDDFLDTFQPWGMTAEDQMQGEGPLIVVVENLTRAANHSERANIHISAESRTASGISTTLMSVPAQDRPGNEAYRDTFVLNCKDVQSVSMQATLNRVSVISESVSGVFQGENETIYLATEGASVEEWGFQRGQIIDAAETGVENAEDSEHSVCRIEMTDQNDTVRVDIPVVSTFSSFTRNTHFECGSVLVFGITEGRVNGAIDWQTYECDYFLGTLGSEQIKRVTGADIVLFRSMLSAEDLEYIDEQNILSLWAEQGEEALTEDQRQKIEEFKVRTASIFNSYFRDPGHFLLTALFPYPKQYMTIGLALPQFTNLDNIRFLIEEAAEQMTTIPAP